jgi:hypothetical protein
MDAFAELGLRIENFQQLLGHLEHLGYYRPIDDIYGEVQMDKRWETLED